MPGIEHAAADLARLLDPRGEKSRIDARFGITRPYPCPNLRCRGIGSPGEKCAVGIENLDGNARPDSPRNLRHRTGKNPGMAVADGLVAPRLECQCRRGRHCRDDQPTDTPSR